MTEQLVWSPDELRRSVSEAVVLATPSARARVEKTLPYPIVAGLSSVPKDVTTVIAIGGGTLLDEVKVWRKQQRPDIRLVAAASIWGSGAEGSRVAVLNREKKEILVDDALVPDVRLRWPELGETVPRALAREACGDATSHAFEALVSPVASPAVRADSARVLVEMFALPLAYDPAWFEVSVRACVLQAASSVGLVHGIAHVLELSGSAKESGARLTHAALCSTYLLPVLEFDLARSEKVDRLLQEYGVPLERCRRRFAELHDEDLYRTLLPALAQEWPAIVRDRCTRTNPALVRPDSLAFFQTWRQTAQVQQ